MNVTSSNSTFRLPINGYNVYEGAAHRIHARRVLQSTSSSEQLGKLLTTVFDAAELDDWFDVCLKYHVIVSKDQHKKAMEWCTENCTDWWYCENEHFGFAINVSFYFRSDRDAAMVKVLFDQAPEVTIRFL